MICFIFLGCGNINLQSSTELNDNESGTAKLQIIYDNSILSNLNGTIFDQQWMKDNGFMYNNYTKDNKNIEEIRYDFKNLKDLQDKIQSTNVIKMSYSKKIGAGNDTYSIKLNFDKTNIDNLIKNNINTGNKNKDEQIYNYLQNVVLSNDIKIPGSIVDSNNTEKVNNNTYRWNYKLNQIDDNTEMLFSYKLKNNIIPITSVAVAAILGISGYVYLKKIKPIKK
jgi:hypothetical protein